MSPFTIRKRVSILKTVFRFAIENELMKRSHQPIISLPPNGEPRARFIDPETELAKILKAIDGTRTPDHLRLLCIILFLTGCRRGAALSLKWEHIDFEKNVIRFRAAQTKKAANKRRGDKPMEGELLDEMKRAYEARDERCDYVISYRGRQVRNPYHGLKAIFRRAGITDLRTHDIRRSSATYVHTETDGDLAAAANHIVDTEATARKHYVQEDPSVHMPAMNAVSSVLARAKQRADAARRQGGEGLSRGP